jgi:hypothetical protein
MTFNIAVSSLELVNSAAMFPADSSVFEITASPRHRVSVLLCSGGEGLEPFATHIIIFVKEFPRLDSNQP